MKQYSFVTTWKIAADINAVWPAIHESEEWPAWWRSIKSVRETQKGDVAGIGSIRKYKIQSPMYYTLTFNLLLTQLKEHRLLEGKVSGDLQGTGSWYFRQEGSITEVTCYWNVTTNIAWMNALSWLLKPVFAYNHMLVMKEGAKSLAQKLGTSLVSFSAS